MARPKYKVGDQVYYIALTGMLDAEVKKIFVSPKKVAYEVLHITKSRSAILITIEEENLYTFFHAKER